MPKRPEPRQKKTEAIPAPLIEQPATLQYGEVVPVALDFQERAPIGFIAEEVMTEKPWTPTQQMVLTPHERLRYKVLQSRQETEQMRTEVRKRDAEKIAEKMASLAVQKRLLSEQALTAQLRAQLAVKEIDDQLVVLASQKEDAVKDGAKKSDFNDEWKAVSDDVKKRLDIPAGYAMGLDLESGAVTVEKQ